jgi:hypothetical protein
VNFTAGSLAKLTNSFLRTAGEGGKGKSDYEDNQGDKEEHSPSSQVVHREHHVIHSVSPTFLPAVGCYLVGSLKGEDEADWRWRASLSQRTLLPRVLNSNSPAGPSTPLKTLNKLKASSSTPFRVQ